MKKNKTYLNMPVEVIDIDYKLDGIVKVDDKIYKVPFSNIGDVIQIIEVNHNKSIPIITKFNFIKQSNNSRRPLCKYYGLCGGCKGQHLQVDDYIRIKKK